MIFSLNAYIINFYRLDNFQKIFIKSLNFHVFFLDFFEKIDKIILSRHIDLKM